MGVNTNCTMQPKEQEHVIQDAVAVREPEVELAKTKVSIIKKKSKGAVTIKGGVTMREMVVDAIITQKERLGPSLSAIKSHLSSKYKIDAEQKAGALNRMLKKMREEGVFVPGAPAGRKGSGCYKLSAEEKERRTVAQRAAAKKLKVQQKLGSGKVSSKAPKKIAKKTVKKADKAPAKKASAAKKSATKNASLAKKPAAKKSAAKQLAAKKPAAKKPSTKKMGAKPKSAVKGKSAK